MDQLHLPLHQNKHGNGRHQHKQFSERLQELINDLEAAESLRREELRRTRQLRGQVYREAKQSGINGNALRAMLELQRSWGVWGS